MMIRSKTVSFREQYKNFNNSRSDNDSSDDELLSAKKQLYDTQIKGILKGRLVDKYGI